MNFIQLSAAVICLISTIDLFAQPIQRYEFKHSQMGTQFKIILYSNDKYKVQNTVNQCFKRIDQLNLLLSDYDAQSEISLLSATAGQGKKIKVSPTLWTILKKSILFSKKSDGAFDISIGPLSKLWRSMIRKKEIFSKTKIQSAKSKVGFNKIKLYPFYRRVELLQKGMRLDLGGIAKGFTVDEVVKILRKNGFTKFLVDGGGDIYAGNSPPNQLGWQINITIEIPKGQEKEKLLLLENTAIASSGDTYRFLEWEGKRYSHIIDPRTGYGVLDEKIINVQARNCMRADVIASTLSVLNAPETASFLKKVKKVKVF